MPSGGNYPCTFFEGWDNSWEAFFGSGGDCHNRLTALAQCCTAHKIYLTPDTAVLISPNRICTYLPRNIYLYRRINGVELLIFHNLDRVIGMPYIHKYYGWVIIHIIVELPLTKAE